MTQGISPSPRECDNLEVPLGLRIYPYYPETYNGVF